MFFDEKFIDELKGKINIVDVVGKYCALKRRGNNHWACCPLPGHSEKTPSFTVNEPGQFFKCFGCGRGGDVITFMMTMENLDYVGAVKHLAEQAGMQLPDDDRDYEKTAKDRNDRDRMLALMKTTAFFYCHNLATEQALPHRKYLQSRKIDKGAITAFGLGASTDWDSLPRHLKEKGFTEEEMVKCGVCAKNDRGEVYDSLGGRLIIPIINNMKNVIAFGGRLLDKKPTMAKYKNTQETELFVKNRTLYNINNLKKERAKGLLSEIIMVEGYMDTISVYQAGFHNVVASMGTSLTLEQARMLKRYADTVLISYDGDGAGQKATIRGLEILKNEGLNVKVVCLPEGLDPDDVIKTQGAEGYAKLLEESIPLVDFKIKNLKKTFNLKDTGDKRRYISEALKIISEIDSASEREDLLRKLGKDTDTTFVSLQRDLERTESGTPEKGEQNPVDIITKTSDGAENAERFLLCACLFNKSYAAKLNLYEMTFTSPTREKLADIISENRDNGKEIYPATVASLLGQDELEEYNAVLSSGDMIFGERIEEKYFGDCVTLLEQQRLKSELSALNKLFEEETDLEKRKNIAKMIAGLTIKMRKY
ncbi:MAG: DNA primase [Clostridia bacterium]|nr:DNA primase [Clostridia bacterium]